MRLLNGNLDALRINDKKNESISILAGSSSKEFRNHSFNLLQNYKKENLTTRHRGYPRRGSDDVIASGF